jgi:hypothetical protein
MRLISNTQPVTNATALAWASARGLSPSSSQIRRLAGFLDEISRIAPYPVQLFLNRSEFLARDGAVHHAVIGGDATLTGTFANNETGTGFSPTGSPRFEFPNPLKSASLTQFYAIAAVRTDADVNNQVIWSGAGSSDTTTLGPVAAVFRQPAAPKRSGMLLNRTGDTSVNHSRNELFGTHGVGDYFVQGVGFGEIAGGGGQLRSNGHCVDAGGTDLTSVWNNNDNWQLGSTVVGTSNFLTGEISFFIAFGVFLNRQQHYKIVDSAIKHRLLQIPKQTIVAGIGSSTMAEASANPSGVMSQLCHIQESSWQGSWHQRFAQSGTFPGLDFSENFWYNQVKPYMRSLSDGLWKKAVILQLGKNMQDVGSYSSIAAERIAAAERVIVVAKDIVANGVTPYVWTVNFSAPATVGDSTRATNNNLYNDYLVARCAAENIPCFDHRVLRPSGDFDWPTRNEAFFGGADDTHMSPAGCAAFIGDFIATFPNP